MARARYNGAEHQIVTFTDHAEWVLRTARGNVLVLDEARHDDVEVQCERCGRWSPSLAIAETGRWVCPHRACYDHEERFRATPRGLEELLGAVKLPSGVT
jgi:hypothetical protein